MESPSPSAQLSRSDLDAMKGSAVLEFGASWCPHCQAARPFVSAALAGFPEVRFIWAEDGKGQPLGRSFGVKLWPTLIFLKDGQEIERLVRPADAGLIEMALRKIAFVPDVSAKKDDAADLGRIGQQVDTDALARHEGAARWLGGDNDSRQTVRGDEHSGRLPISDRCQGHRI
jgi:thioredoxin 1